MIEKLQKIFEENLDVSDVKISLDTHIVNDLNADSLDVVELVMAIEDEFSVSIDDAYVDKMETVGDVVNHLKTLQ